MTKNTYSLATSFITMLVLVFSISSCDKIREQEYADIGLNYYPYELGTEVVYTIDSVHYSPNAMEYSWEIKEVYNSVYVSNEGNEGLTFNRYLKQSDGQWIFLDKGFFVKTKYDVERSINNNQTIDVVFPVKDGDTWLYDVFNNGNGHELYYEGVDEKSVFGVTSYDSTATVVYAMSSNLIEEVLNTKTYARNFGLVSEQKTDLTLDGSAFVGYEKNVTLKYIEFE